MTTPVPQQAPAHLAIQALWHPEAVHNPYPGYERVRALSHEGLLPVPEWNATFVTGHAATSTLLRSPAARSGGMVAQAPGDTEAMRLLKPMMLFHDGAGHARLRGLVQAAFTPRVVTEQRELVRALLGELLGALPREAETDLVAGLAAPLPARVIMHMLGLHGDDEARFIRWTQSVADLLGGADQSAELMARIEADAREMRQYFRGLADELRASPRPGLLSALAAAQDGGERLSSDELLSNAVLLLAAGHETTSNLIPGGLLELSRQPEAWAALVMQPDHPNVADELLRVVSPVQYDGRSLAEPVTLQNVRLPAGSHAQLLLGAANRDPQVFPEPDRIRWDRSNSARHLAFAAGAHYCLGASLARLEIRETFAALATRFPNLTVTDQAPPFKANPVLRGVTRLNVRLSG
ncbi:cytochrome P450 [Deinococcus deserti]|uniref:Putative cytochrome P450 n=1 Tax=Deinococcus deserti (strain DSM 17065 / CIP 109153 / LMG 22923 / VCD115) TaxID=546414 RepID=C1D056_DEIDV|nr:cytochrome P450 [Deinococcus deserti]ACO47325.1 putative cytochrome P450 [Deinococcus deserti VCD115]